MLDFVVGVARFELTTPASRRQCSTKLSYTPKPATRCISPGRFFRKRVLPRPRPSLRAGRPAPFVGRGDLPVLPAGTNVRPRLGRSQVVRQRLLVPPCAGSNPAAPATQSVLCRAVSPLCGISPGFRGLPDLISIWRRQIAVGGDAVGAPVSVCRRCGSVWSWAGVTRLSGRAQRAAIMAR